MININRLTKKEINWLFNHRCKCGHRYIEIVHPNCLAKHIGNPIQERVGFLDIESGLHADFDYVFSYCIKKKNGKILGRVLTPKEIKTYIFDRDLLKQFVRDIRQFDRVVVYWGKDRRHDLPFLRTRAVTYGIDFPLYQEVKITDVYDIIKSKFKLSHNRLQNACEQFDIPCKTHPIKPKVWQTAKAGHPQSLRYIYDHNKEDVISLELLYDKVMPYVRQSNVSI